MEELNKVALETEMDLIVAHKRSMRLAELAGLSLAAQTTFATAVSEVARYAMEQGTQPVLILNVIASTRSPYLVALIEDPDLRVANPLHLGLVNAQRLVTKLEIMALKQGSRIALYYRLSTKQKLNAQHLAEWRTQFTRDQTLSAYEEIKQKNEQLKQLAFRLQESEQHYKRVTDSLPLLIFTANQAGQLLYANAWLQAYTGASLQVLNQTKWSKHIHPDEYIHFWKQWAKQASAGLPFAYECRLRLEKSGAYEWHLFTAHPVSSDLDTVAALSGFVVNIHAQKIVGQTLQANEELLQAKASLEQSQRALEASVSELNRSNEELTQFAYIASHDLQEPLRKIHQFSDLLSLQYGPALGTTGTDMLGRMQAAAGRMQALVKDLLNFSRLTGQKPFTLLNLRPLVASVVSDLDAVIQQKQATVSVMIDGTIWGHELQIRQLFQNLLSNALKYTTPDQAPQVQLTSSHYSLDQLPAGIDLTGHERYLSISVQDNGIGFEQKYEDRIFRLFQRLHGRGQYEGTGMGLAICKKVVENHQGHLQVRSQPGEGSMFTIYLPDISG